MKNILTIGSATSDVFINYEDAEMLKIFNKQETRSFLLLEAGEKIEIKNIHYYTGGGATNSAVSFHRLGFHVSPICKIGNDDNGKFVLKKLSEEGISTQHITSLDDTMTGTSFIIPSFEHDRTIFAYRGSNTQLSLSDIPDNLLLQQQFLYITSLSGKASLMFKPLVEKAKKHNIRIATNPGISQLKAGAKELASALEFVDIFILNSSEAKQFMQALWEKNHLAEISSYPAPDESMPHLVRSFICNQDICLNVTHFFKEILQRGPSIVVVTNGAEGVYAATKNTMYFHPSLDVKTVNTLGAGDAFGSCFAANIFNDDAIEEALVKGIINACSVISYEDAKTGLLSNQELEKQFKKLGTKGVQRFDL